MKSLTPPRKVFNHTKSVLTFIRYNITHVFVGKFIYFLLLATALFLVIIIINALGTDSSPGSQTVYNFLLIPGVLLVFYPSSYAIQGDIDSRMIETLFGIPDYRYKVWLARSATQYLVIIFLLFLLALFCRVGLADFSVGSMLFHLMFPILFIGSFGFMISALTRSGNSTAVIMVAVILFFWFASSSLEESSWNLFHNPFKTVEELESLLWSRTSLYNRIYLFVASVLAVMFGLLRLQKREKFV
jgi:hypothetical protein